MTPSGILMLIKQNNIETRKKVQIFKNINMHFQVFFHNNVIKPPFTVGILFKYFARNKIKEAYWKIQKVTISLKFYFTKKNLKRDLRLIIKILIRR